MIKAIKNWKDSIKSPKKKRSVADIIGKVCTILIVILMVVYCFSLLFPVYWLIVNSFKGYIEYYVNSYFSLPEAWHWENYAYIFENFHYKTTTSNGIYYFSLGTMTYYSVYSSVLTALYATVTMFLCAYACGRYHDFKLSKILCAVGMFWMLLPAVSDGGAGLLFKKRLGLYDNLTAWILCSGGCIFTGQWFFVVKSYFQGLAKDLADAAYIDGAGQFDVCFKIMMPLATPLMVFIFFLSFLSSWNNYGLFLFYMPSYANLALGIYMYQQNAALLGATIPQVLAGFVVVVVPIVVLYLCSHKLIINNLNIGGIKG